jgi:uncharacterized alpha-E superfamily protein
MFDADNPDSVANSSDRMLGNGMVLRETISSNTLSYLQMAINALKLASASANPVVQMQWVLDDIMAFRGSCEDYIVDETIQMIIKCGVSVERISMFERLSLDRAESEKELRKLMNNMFKSKLPMEPGSQQVIYDHVINNANLSREQLIRSVESLFIL